MKNLPPVVILAFLFLVSGALELAADSPQYTSPDPAEKLFISHDGYEVTVNTGELHIGEREGREERAPRENEELDEAEVMVMQSLPMYARLLPSCRFLPFVTTVHRSFPFNKAPPCPTS